MQKSRRHFLQNAFPALGGISLPGFLPRLAAAPGGVTPMRFIYTGIPGIEGEKVNMHDVGHGKTIGGLEAGEIRRRTELHHMQVMDKIATRLNAHGNPVNHFGDPDLSLKIAQTGPIVQFMA